MTRRKRIASVAVLFFLSTTLSLWLMQEPALQDVSLIITNTLQNQKQKNQIATGDEEQTAEQERALPEFAFKAVVRDTKSAQAFISINQKASQWFQIGDTVIDNYILHDINNSFVTLYDGQGAYYELYLSDNQIEDDYPVEESDADTAEPAIENMIPLGDGNYISYGDRDVSGDSGDRGAMASAAEKADTSGQTVIYGDEDVSQDIDRQEQYR